MAHGRQLSQRGSRRVKAPTQGLKARKTIAQGKPAAAGAALGQQINKQNKPCKGETEVRLSSKDGLWPLAGSECSARTTNTRNTTERRSA